MSFFECALNVLSWDVAFALFSQRVRCAVYVDYTRVISLFFTHMPNLCARNTHTRINDVSLQNSLKVDGDSWSQQYCRASGEMH